MKKQIFNLIVAGYGGQGVLSLSNILAKAALKQGYETKESELHGLAQRGGSLNCHIRFINDEINKGMNKDKNSNAYKPISIYSPVITKGKADLIITLESLEALRACYWANKNTKILINAKTFRTSINLNKILEKIKKITKNVYIIDADKIVKEITNDIMDVNIFMLGYAIKKKFLPIKKQNAWQAIEERINKIFLKENKKVFDKAFEI